MDRFKWLFIILFLSTFCVTDVYADIVLKLLVVNPSGTQRKTVAFKTYLPKEVKPEDIIDKGELGLAYDTQKSCYYVYKDFELDPKESITRSIKIKNIWRFSQEELDSLRSEAVKLARMMENTEFFERANFLRNSIESKLDEIVQRQNRSVSAPDVYISDYRHNLKLIEAVKSDLQSAKSSLMQARPIAPATIWKLTVGVVIFLGLLGLSYFFVWQRQIKVVARSEMEAKVINVQDTGLVEHKRETEKNKVGVEDIEQRLKNSKE